MKKINYKFSNWKVQTILLAIFFTVGIIGHFLDFTFSLMIFLTPYILFISGVWAIHKGIGMKYVVFWILIAYIITFTLEVIGAEFSIIFGPYDYGNALGFKFLNVPVIIGLNWVIIILSLALFSEWFVNFLFESRVSFKIHILLSALFTGIFATIFDYIMEPAAVGLGYWFWTLTSDPFNIPLQNYIAWFVISFIFALTYLIIPKEKRITQKESPHSIWFVVIQVIFFIAMRILIFLK